MHSAKLDGFAEESFGSITEIANDITSNIVFVDQGPHSVFEQNLVDDVPIATHFHDLLAWLRSRFFPGLVCLSLAFAAPSFFFL